MIIRVGYISGFKAPMAASFATHMQNKLFAVLAGSVFECFVYGAMKLYTYVHK